MANGTVAATPRKRVVAVPRKRKRSTASIAGWAAGTATLGAGFIDRRQGAKPSSKYLGSSWDQVRKHMKPGDVIVGANKTAPESLKVGIRDVKKYWKSSKGVPLKRRLKRAGIEFDVASVVSKFSDPSASHAAVLSTKSHQAYSSSGANYKMIDDLPSNQAERKWIAKRYGENAHFTVLRPKKGVSDIPDLQKQKGSEATRKIVGRRAGSRIKDYKGGAGIKNQLIDWVTPKLRKHDVVKSEAVRKLEACTIGGTCGTTGASFSKKTTGGKTSAKVLPKDYLKSSDYNVVGHIGQGKTSRLSKSLFAIPKYLVKGTAAAAVGTAVYGGVKGYQAIKNRMESKRKRKPLTKTSSIYNEASRGEVLKLLLT